jgi:HEAT repeat protein
VDALGTLGNESIAVDLWRLFENKQTDLRLRVAIAESMLKLGDRSPIPDLFALLEQQEGDKNICNHIIHIIGNSGEKAVVPRFLCLLEDKKQLREVRIAIAQTLEAIAEDEETVRRLAELLSTLDLKTEDSPLSDRVIGNTIHCTLWSISRRAGVNVIIDEKRTPQHIEIMRWHNH